MDINKKQKTVKKKNEWKWSFSTFVEVKRGTETEIHLRIKRVNSSPLNSLPVNLFYAFLLLFLMILVLLLSSSFLQFCRWALHTFMVIVTQLYFYMHCDVLPPKWILCLQLPVNNHSNISRGILWWHQRMKWKKPKLCGPKCESIIIIIQSSALLP